MSELGMSTYIVTRHIKHPVEYGYPFEDEMEARAFCHWLNGILHKRDNNQKYQKIK